MKRKISVKFWLFFVSGFLLVAASTSAQSIAYRQTNLASDVPGLANHTDPFLLNPWGIAVVPGQSFFVANANQGHVISLDATGSRVAPPGFSIPNPAGTGAATPTGIVADPNSFFRDRNTVPPFIISAITATADGGIYFWAVNADGTFLQQANLVVDHSHSGAVYTGLAILTPDCCAPFLAAANFHSGFVESFTTNFSPLTPLGSFTDPGLPAGYAPYGMQLIGRQVFITYSLQDAAKQNPVLGAGNGVVSVFDLTGAFVRRFATGGALNAPWGIAQASASFGPFSNDILIGNVGDGTVNAFDPVTGNFAGQIKDGDGNVLVIAGLHGLAFRSDGLGDPNALYFTAGIGNAQDGLFGAITTGLVSTTRVSVPTTPANIPVTITVTVSAGPGNSGNPKGSVTLKDGGIPISDAPLTNGMILFNTVIRGVGTHLIEAQYHGDNIFLPSSSQTELEVTGPSTTLTLAAPANAAPGESVTLRANISSATGTPSGQIAFEDGNTAIGTAPLNAAGIATLTINTLAVGTHSLFASYAGDGSFGGSVSAPVTTMIAVRDFSLGAAPTTATVTAGQSTSFNITVTPAGGFGDPITFSCPILTGITCSFNPAIVTPNGGLASTMLTVTTSADVLHFGRTLDTGSGFLLASLALIGMLSLLKKGTHQPYGALLRLATSTVAVIILALTLISCGGYGTSAQTYRGTASVTVKAQSGATASTTTLSITVQ
jgi:uncharacterized protein (TIGR03118 family)